jgi:hypothetical protein
MAGKTLTGIGEDESGRHELGTDSSDSFRAPTADKPPSARPTDKMPMYVGPSDTPTIQGAMPPMGGIDEDKVAEGLKKLRSLDEPLGPIPTVTQTPTMREGIPPLTFPTPVASTSSTPTLKETPVVGLPTPVNPAAIAAAAAAELIRSRGTAHGHALSVAAGKSAALPVSVDDRMKGTLLGHSLHLPDLPEVPPEDSRPAEVRPVAATPESLALVRGSTTPEIARRDVRPFSMPLSDTSSTFGSDLASDELSEPELENPRGKTMLRGAIFLAVVSVFVVAAIAWGRFHKTEPPAEVLAPSPAPAPSEAQPAAAAPPAPAPAEAQAAAPAPPAPAPAVAPAPATPQPAAAAPFPEEDIKPAAEAPAAPRAKPKHPAVAAGRPAAAAAHAVKPAAPPREPKPLAPGKRAKDEDPDGTLPLTE